MNDYLQFGGYFLTWVLRPNGKWYRPRKLRVEYIEANLWDEEDHVLVLGTWDEQVALLAAGEEIRRMDPSLIPLYPVKGWWRLGIIRDEPTWVWDEARGAAGVVFAIEEIL